MKRIWFTHKKGTCEICGRTTFLHKHHLKPRGCKPRDNLSRESVAWLCLDCSRMVHHLFSRRELTQLFFSIDRLKSDSRVMDYVRSIRKKKVQGLHPSMKR